MIEGKLLPMLYVRDVAKSVEFYRDALGFDFKGFWDDARHVYAPEPPAGAPPVFAELVAGDLILHLHRTDADQKLPETAASILHLQVADADAQYDRVKSRLPGVTAPVDQPWGWRQFYVRDPDGHQWSFRHPL